MPFEDLRPWCLDIGDKPIEIGKRLYSKFPTYDLFCDQFELINKHHTTIETATIEDTWDRHLAPTLWEETEKILNAVQHWCTIQNIKHFSENHPEIDRQYILSQAANPDSNLYHRMYKSESRWSNITGAISSTHRPEDKVIPQLCKAGVLNPQLVMNAKFTQDLIFLRKAGYQRRDGGRGAVGDEYARLLAVPKITDENAKALLYPRYCNVIKTLRAALNVAELRDLIPLPLDEKRLEVEREKRRAEYDQQAEERHISNTSRKSLPEIADEINKFLERIVPDSDDRAFVLTMMQDDKEKRTALLSSIKAQNENFTQTENERYFE